ncbi:uncharacterized protein HMPREF1541_01138 [Cyphellophora europaea CBS 101466]|uniref:Uncharacterized protein n=1 Tax=Cyphellophora europaea (strain CBS 101466) TaxID=1220924 RepID=W2SGF4_CYPE1|nr:uncharacterized protein HMPREF1541_01138 [Cyphellophora europaea CBS 101466]ETN46949.1 hypothetical protein HMPREF1541_01138 [Cyphellophora europaea CBS 101466]
MQSYNHYQNSSFKTSPAQRDATSRNAAIYEAARGQRDVTSEAGADTDGTPKSGNHVTEERQEIQTADSSERRQAQQQAQLPGFETDTRGNVYLTGETGVSKLWRKASGLFARKSAGKGNEDIVR